MVASPQDVDARGELLYGAWLAGISLGAVSMGLHHKLCHVLGGSFNLPHAEVHTIILPQVMRYNQDADGWLHTGNIGYFDEDGYLFIVDRLKELIKYKGMQVAPAELEAVMLTHPAVADVAVIPSADEEAGEVPKAFVVLKPGTSATADGLMAYVAERVAPHKRIRRLEFVDQIPKSASGKILRRVLIDQERAQALAVPSAEHSVTESVPEPGAPPMADGHAEPASKPTGLLRRLFRRRG